MHPKIGLKIVYKTTKKYNIFICKTIKRFFAILFHVKAS
jgi:hypothetical protein